MAKTVGITGVTVSVGDPADVARDLSSNVSTVDLDLPHAEVDWTTIDQQGIDRAVGLGDATVVLNCFFDPSANKVHAVFSTGFGVPRHVVVTAPGPKTFSAVMLHSAYPYKLATTRLQTIAITLKQTGGVPGAWS